jgi:ubiquinone/menaquinone biosynthesis C-methylase UbiE
MNEASGSSLLLDTCKASGSSLLLDTSKYNGSLIAIPHKNETFDLIICNDSKDLHMISRRFMFKELYRVLKFGGTLKITDTTINETDLLRMEYIKGLIRAHFHIISIIKKFKASDTKQEEIPNGFYIESVKPLCL